MDNNTVKALLELDVVTVSGVKLIQIPYEDILRGKISLTINEVKSISQRLYGETPIELESLIQAMNGQNLK